MRIKTKLLWGLSSKPILILLIIGIGLFQVSSINKLNDSTQTNFQLSLLAEEIHREVKNEAISLRNIVIFTDENLIQKELTRLQMESESKYQNIVALDSKVYTKEQRDMIDDLKNTNQKFNIYKDQVIELVSIDKKQEAIDLINNYGHTIHEEFLQVIEGITENLETNVLSTFNIASENIQKQIIISSLIALLSIIISASFLVRTVWTFAARLSKVSRIMSKIANGNMDLDTRVDVVSNDEIDEVAHSFNSMVYALKEHTLKEKNLTWSKSNIAEITTSLSGMHDLDSLSNTFLSKIVPLMESCHATVYVKEMDEHHKEHVFKLRASYAHQKRKYVSNTFSLGEGLVGQAALENSPIILTDVPSDYIQIKSGLGEASPLNIYLVPISFEGNVIAVLEMAAFKPFSASQQTFLEELIGSVGIILDSVIGRIQLAKLLEETQVLMEEIQAQSEELQSQQEELRVTNEELEEQTQVLRYSEEKLQVQQEELEQTNIELKEKAESLEEQNRKFEVTNREVESARAELEEKARLLTLSSKYKSEFLANMSHELRTPLNSLLILSRLLSDNHEGNLSDKQVEYSKTIYASGKDLLTLINDILDLAKIESGKMDTYYSNVQIKGLIEILKMRFRPVANEKGLHFNIVLKEGTPQSIYTDEKRLLQVLENLLSNAFKFTEQGEINLVIDVVSQPKQKLLFSVIDTGIGISREKQEFIFEAFQQADGTTSRKYGGTGLGLSICREISILLGGEIKVESDEGKGSTFTFCLDDYQVEELDQEIAVGLDEVAVTKEAEDDKSEIHTIESAVLDSNQKSSSYTSNVQIKRLLIVDDDMKQRISLMELFGDMNVIIKAVSTGAEALEELKVNSFDFMVLDLGLTDMNGFDLLKKIKESGVEENLRIVIYTGRNLSSREEIHLNQYTHSIIIKDEMAPQRLKDEVELFLNNDCVLNESSDPFDENQIKSLPGLEGKKVLLVDDDVRNVYALSSFLELYGLNITFAENGVECLDVLEVNSNFDLVLMDIMMPEMDGYEAIQRIRAIPDFYSLPIIALTAKAMKEDREKCLEVGASDYIVKPFNPEQLISLIQVWLYPQEGK